MSSSKADVVVLGGGLIGLATAYELAKRGREVTVLERHEAGGDQSRHALGFLSLVVKGAAKARLSARAVEQWAALPGELEADFELRRGGELAVATDAAAFQRLRDWSAGAAASGIDARVVDPDEIAKLVPGFRRPTPGGVLVAAAGHAEPLKAPLAYAAAARRRGVTIREHCPATAIEVVDGRIAGVRTAAGPIAARTVVCATGAANTRVLRTVGVRLPTVVVRGLALETAPLPAVTEVATMVGGLAFRQRPGGTLYVSYITRGIHDLTLDSFRFMREFLPSRNRSSLARVRLNDTLARDVWRSLAHRSGRTPAIDPRPLVRLRSPRGVVEESVRIMESLSPAFAGLEVRRDWSEAIDVTPDDLPVLGPVATVEGLIVASGFSGHGFTLGPLAGRLVAELVVDGRASEDLHPLRLARFAEGDFTPSGARL